MRSRNIRPGFFQNEELVELPVEARLLCIGLWCIADREGRLEDRPRKIKLQIFPLDQVNVDYLLLLLESSGFIVRYVIDGHRFIKIENFSKHQHVHHNEQPSKIPPPDTITAGQIDLAEALLSERITEDEAGFSTDRAIEILEKAKLATMVASTFYHGSKHVAPRERARLTKVVPCPSCRLDTCSLEKEKQNISAFSTPETAIPPEPNIPAATAADIDLPETASRKTGKSKKPVGSGKAKPSLVLYSTAMACQGDDGNADYSEGWLSHSGTTLGQGLVQHGSAAQRPALHGAEGEGEERSPPVVTFITRSKKKLNGWKASAFQRFWETFDFKRGRAEAADAWLNIADLTAETAEAIIRAAAREAKDRPGLLADGGKPKWPQGWLTGRRWEDEALIVEGASAPRPESWAERKTRELAEKGIL